MQSFESASMAVHVQTEPNPSAPLSFALSLQPQNDQISSSYTRFDASPRTNRSWYWAQNVPASAISRSTVIFDTPTSRAVELMELPSQRAARIVARFSVLSYLMPGFYLSG